MERIIAAAVLSTGRSHADAIQKTFRRGIEGFLTDQGRFLDRKEAMFLARQNGQLESGAEGAVELRSHMVKGL